MQRNKNQRHHPKPERLMKEWLTVTSMRTNGKGELILQVSSSKQKGIHWLDKAIKYQKEIREEINGL